MWPDPATPADDPATGPVPDASDTSPGRAPATLPDHPLRADDVAPLIDKEIG